MRMAEEIILWRALGDLFSSGQKNADGDNDDDDNGCVVLDQT